MMRRQLTNVMYIACTAFLATAVHAQDDLIEQWAVGVGVPSSGSNSIRGGPESLTGEPDASCEATEDEGFEDEGFEGNSWRAGTPDEGQEWVEVRFEQPVFATAVLRMVERNANTVEEMVVIEVMKEVILEMCVREQMPAA